MRERRALRMLHKIAAGQTALCLASEASLARALEVERTRDADVVAAQSRLEQSIDDWRGALTREAVDTSVLQLFAQAPQWRQSELDDAEAAQSKAQAHTAAQRLRHSEIMVRLRRSALLHKRLRKKLDRKQEEKALSALEHQVGRAVP